jgi:NAD(P)-dependent dehydrogenase (short-subunit alcohol dehydrogenase family)
MTTVHRRCCLITGANRGLGFEFVRQLIERGDFVVAACRTPNTAAELQLLVTADTGLIVALDVADARSVGAATALVAERIECLDLLVNAAGVEDTPDSAGPLRDLDAEALVHVYRTNAIGPALVTQGFAALLQRSERAVVANLTSSLGSLTASNTPGGYGYAMSKAALNMLTRKLAADLDGVLVVGVSPGWVRTDMGGEDAPLSSHDSVADMIALLATLGPEHGGLALTHTGQRLPW